MSKFLSKAKTFFESNTGKLTLGIISMVVAGIVTAKIIDKTKGE